MVDKKAIKKLRSDMGKIKFEEDITTLNQQQGAGKSTFIRNYCNKHPEENIAILTKRHNWLKECEKKVDGFCHWYGQKHFCKHPDFNKFDSVGLYGTFICKTCSKKCNYREQFNNTFRVGAPTEYLNTEYLFPRSGEDGFDKIFIEEKITETTPFWFKADDIVNGSIAIALNYEFDKDKAEWKDIWEFEAEGSTTKPLLENVLWDFSNAVENKDYEFLEKYINIAAHIKKEVIVNAIKKQDIDILKEVQKFDINMLKGYLKYGKIYNYNKEVYYEPRIYKAFDMAKAGTKIVLSHAGFDEQLFKDLLARYEREFPATDHLTFGIHTSNLENKDTKCYQITNKGFGRRKLEEKYVIDFLQKIDKIYKKKNVGVITYKEYTQYDATKKMDTAWGFEAAHFGDTSGLNKFENKDVLIIIGTYTLSIGEKVRKYNGLYNASLNPSNFPYVDKGKFPDYIGTELEIIQRVEEENEMIDVIHRNRGLIHDRRIYVLGIVPERIKKELAFELIKTKDVPTFLFNLKRKKRYSHSKI
ncbi:MAG: hypothetical protein Q7J35_11230 [Candidatus Methanoperedens sp.]|nr:hypothetical protein [Candidatus Methanoperedens sp.]